MCNGALDARATDIAEVLNIARVPDIAGVFDTAHSLDTAGVCDSSLTFVLFALCGLMPVGMECLISISEFAASSLSISVSPSSPVVTPACASRGGLHA